MSDIIKNDPLKIFRGNDFVVNSYITIHQPTLDEIADWGESKYWALVYTLVATPTDMKLELDKIGVDWNEITDFECFLYFYTLFTPDFSGIIFGDLDMSAYQIALNNENGETVLYNVEEDSVIDKSIYTIITDYVRKSHGLKKNEERAMNDTTKRVLLEEAEENAQRNKNKADKSLLLELISTMCCMEGFKYNHNDVWQMKINAFIDAVQRVQKIKNVDLLLQSGYSGFGVDLKKISKRELNYFESV